jgi:hypothetical protein
MFYRLLFTSLFFFNCLFSNEIEESFIINPHTHEKIEFFFLKPSNEGPHPVIFIIHGDQPNPSKGGKQLVEAGYLQKFTNENVLAVAVSIPGYGNSEGLRDYAGPRSQQAIGEVIYHFSQLPFVNPSKMGLYCISKGAILGSMIHRYSPPLALQILEAGAYDLILRSSELPTYLHRILDVIKQETENTEGALKERSAVYHTQHVKANTLILHGEVDDRMGLSSAKQLHSLFLSQGKKSTLKIFPKTPHHILPEKWNTIIPFIRMNFFEICGIGIEIRQCFPAIQITDIYPNSQAAKAEKLQIGDAILGISPNNDDNEIDALEMTLSQFTALMLGKQGTSVRLHVLHFDNTEESIDIIRGLQ